MLNHWAPALGKDVRAYSAGSAPSGRFNPLRWKPCATPASRTGFGSKSWTSSPAPGPRLRVVITVCDSAAAETCPYWPGSPVRVHWGYADPTQCARKRKTSDASHSS